MGRGERCCRTVKPLKGPDVPPGVVIVSARVPGSALLDIVTRSERVVAVPPGPIAAVTPAPLKVAAVAPIRLVPVTATMNVVPGIPILGVIAVMLGGLVV